MVNKQIFRSLISSFLFPLALAMFGMQITAVKPWISIVIVVILMILWFFMDMRWTLTGKLKEIVCFAYLKPNRKRIVNAIHCESFRKIDGSPLFYAGDNADSNSSKSEINQELKNLKIGRMKKPFVYYTLGLREKFNCIDFLYILLVKEFIQVGCKCIICIHGEGYESSEQKKELKQKFNRIRDNIKKVLENKPCKIWFSYDIAVGTNIRQLADFFYFDLLFITRVFFEDVLKRNENIIKRLKSILGKTYKDSIEISEECKNEIQMFGEDIVYLRDKQYIAVKNRISEITSNAEYPKQSYVDEEIKRLINRMQNPFSSKWMTNLIANAMDLYPVLIKIKKNRVLFLIHWEYQAEMWKTMTKHLSDIQKIYISGNTLRNDEFEPVPVYDYEIAINILDREYDLLTKILDKEESFGISGFANISKHLATAQQIFETYEQRISKIAKDGISLSDLIVALRSNNYYKSQKSEQMFTSRFQEIVDKILLERGGEDASEIFLKADDLYNRELKKFYYQERCFDTIMNIKMKYNMESL